MTKYAQKTHIHSLLEYAGIDMIKAEAAYFFVT